jgi:hypothetical protein
MIRLKDGISCAFDATLAKHQQYPLCLILQHTLAEFSFTSSSNTCQPRTPSTLLVGTRFRVAHLFGATRLNRWRVVGVVCRIVERASWADPCLVAPPADIPVKACWLHEGRHSGTQVSEVSSELVATYACGFTGAHAHAHAPRPSIRRINACVSQVVVGCCLVTEPWHSHVCVC